MQAQLNANSVDEGGLFCVSPLPEWVVTLLSAVHTWLCLPVYYITFCQTAQTLSPTLTFLAERPGALWQKALQANFSHKLPRVVRSCAGLKKKTQMQVDHRSKQKGNKV